MRGMQRKCLAEWAVIQYTGCDMAQVMQII